MIATDNHISSQAFRQGVSTVGTGTDQLSKRTKEFQRAAKAAGIDIDTIPGIPPVEEDAPTEAELETPRISDGEWALLEGIFPRKSRYLSKIAPREFLDACLYLAMVEFKFRLVPTPGFNTEAFRAKFYRSCLAGVFAELAACALTHDAFAAGHVELLTELRAAEECYVRRHRRIVEDRRKELARAYATPREPG